MDMLLDLLSEYYPKVLGKFILEYYYGGYHYGADIYYMCKQGANALFDINGLSKYDLEDGLKGVCWGGYMKIVKLMIEKGASNFNGGLENACLGGHMEIVKLMIEKGADEFNWGLSYACRYNHMEIAKLMIEKGAGNFSWGLRNACSGGHMEIAKLMIEKGATHCDNCNNTEHPELLP